MTRLNGFMAKTRSLAYASELGESIRPIVSPLIVKLLYGVSWGYVFLDTGLKIYSIQDQGTGKMILYGTDTFIWHALASMLLPATTIHAIVKYSNKLIKKFKKAPLPMKRFGPTIMGLASIPFIIHPIDHFTDWGMDNTIRNFYFDKLPKKMHH